MFLSFVCGNNKRVISEFRHAGAEVQKYFFISMFRYGWSVRSFGESLGFCEYAKIFHPYKHLRKCALLRLISQADLGLQTVTFSSLHVAYGT